MFSSTCGTRCIALSSLRGRPLSTITVNTSITRCAAYILPSLDHLPTPVIAERTSQVTSFIIRACGDQSRLMDSDQPARPVLSVDDFTVNLVDTILAILQAPTSVAAGG